VKHADHHTFRDKSDNANVYVRNYVTAKERASLKKQYHENCFLKKTVYDQNEAGTRKHYLRPKQHLKEDRQRMHHQPLNVSERVQDQINR